MKNIALLFPGQGSQYVGMGKKLFDNYAVAREVFDEANEVLGFDLKTLCFEGELDELTKTINAQPAILTCSVAAYKVYMEEFGIQPNYYAGHSLGEFSALACAGVYRFADCLQIVRERGRLMQEVTALGIGSMKAVSGIEKETIKKKCEEYSKDGEVAVISNYNAPDQIVISGHVGAVEKVGKALEELGARTVSLKVSAPFHSPLMAPMKEEFKTFLKQYTYGDFNGTVLSNVTGLPYRDQDVIIENLTEQLVSPVQWESTMQFLSENGVKTVMEIGPKTVLKKLAKKNVTDMQAFSYDREDEIEKFREVVRANPDAENDAIPKPTVVTRCLAVAVCTRNRNWDKEEYKKGVVEPYQQIQKIQKRLDETGEKPSFEEMKTSLEMLKTIFDTKKTPKEEQRERFNQILDETGTRLLLKEMRF